MRRCATFPLAVTLLTAALLLPLTAKADRATAEFFAERGAKALRDESWAEAEEFYRRALGEDEAFLPARIGLAEALLGARKRNLAVKELRRACADAATAEDLPASWKSDVKRAKRLLAKVDKTGAEFAKLLGDHVEALVKFARKWKAKDPDMAIKALGQALALDPECEDARELLGQLQGSGTPKGEPLFNGRDFTGWGGANSRIWRVENGIIVGQVGDEAWQLRSDRRYSGNYDVLMEARFVEKTGRVVFFGLMGAINSNIEKTLVGYIRDAVCMLEYPGTDEHEEPFMCLPDNMHPPIDISKWNVYELRFRDDRIHAFVNGKEIKSIPRREERAEGFLGVIVQCCTVQIKRIDYRPR